MLAKTTLILALISPAFIAFIPSAGAVLTTETVPTTESSRIIATLRQHNTWISIAYQDGSADGAEHDALIIAEQKIWRTRTVTQALRLEEITELTITPTIPGPFSWGKARFDPKAPFDPGLFTLYALVRPDAAWQVRFIGDERIHFASTDGTLNIVLAPLKTTAQPKPANPLPLPRGAVFSAPLGPLRTPLRENFNLTREEGAVVRQDLSAPKTVLIDPSWPKRFRSSLLDAFKKWNLALGSSFFQVAEASEPLDTADCLSREIICVRWKGSEELAWTGSTGNTAFSFDPKSGLIIGSVITFRNPSAKDSLSTASIEDERLLKPDLTARDVAHALLRRETFLSLRHPRPDGAVQSILLHEIGHVLALPHDFAGSVGSTPLSPSDSVMDYIPFPVSHRMADVGERDRDMLETLYRGRPLKEDHRICDEASMRREIDCVPYDVGDPTSWAALLVSLANENRDENPREGEK